MKGNIKNEIIDFFMYRFVSDPKKITEYDRYLFVSGGICALLVCFIVVVFCMAVWPSLTTHSVIR